MSSRSDALLLADMREAVDKILRYVVNMTEAEFAANDLTMDAVIRNIEVMGEAASKLSDEYVEAHADVPFRQMTALRNRLIHGYFGISLPILWKVIQDDLPPLKHQLSSM